MDYTGGMYIFETTLESRKVRRGWIKVDGMVPTRI
jgi:hypothetical protein